MGIRFDEVITTHARLREIVGENWANPRDKVVDHINEAALRFIRVSPFVVVGTRGSDGLVDLSPKGDAPGFVEVLDEKTVVIPDRPGNRRVDSFENLMSDTAVGLFFIIPGNKETLRVAGRGRVVRDRAIQERHAVNGKQPGLALVATVEEVFMHCSKAFVRSRLWSPDAWPDRADVPSLAEWVKLAAKPESSIEELQSIHDNDAEERLY